MSRRPARWHGLLPIAKIPGPTSHDVVDMARKALRQRRIGHTGTLDPSAEGLLLLLAGQATRLQQYLLGWDKTYVGEIRLGHATTTYDIEGERIEPSGPVPDLTRDDLDTLETAFSGRIEQMPPPFSAKKVAGKKLYELAREGKAVDVEPKSVTVFELHLSVHAPGVLRFEVRTSSGFYVRSLAHDLGIRLGCGGHLIHLKRVAIGPYSLDDALDQEALEAAGSPEEVLTSHPWIPLHKIQLPFPSVDLNPATEDRFLHGGEVIILRKGEAELTAGDSLAVRGRNGGLLGIGTVGTVLARGRTVVVRPRMVLDGGKG
ncbi:MAG: tRNA pseudouridine(55) synthase TruB [Acidobacteria bacterium]|nr:tRNA pseudouridine(55) synthase TruB [Acidobacteriota bacterium]